VISEKISLVANTESAAVVEQLPVFGHKEKPWTVWTMVHENTTQQ